jgi:hypothetical protein
LTLRVVRLLDPLRNTSTRRSRGLLGSWAAALAMLAVVLAHVELVVAAAPLTSPTPDPSVVVRPAPQPGAAVNAGATRQLEAAAVPSLGSEQSDQAPRAADQTGSVTPASPPPPAPRDIVAAPIARLESGPWQLPDLPASIGAAPVSVDPPAAVTAPAAPAADSKPTTPWGAAADAGISVSHGSQKAASATADAGTSVGRSSQKAAVATAGFFSKLGRKIAGSF